MKIALNGIEKSKVEGSIPEAVGDDVVGKGGEGDEGFSAVTVGKLRGGGKFPTGGGDFKVPAFPVENSFLFVLQSVVLRGFL